MKKLLGLLSRLVQRSIDEYGFENQIAMHTHKLEEVTRILDGLTSLNQKQVEHIYDHVDLISQQQQEHMFSHVDVITRERDEAVQDAIQKSINEHVVPTLNAKIQAESAALRRRIDASRFTSNSSTSDLPKSSVQQNKIDDLMYVSLEDAFRGDPSLIRSRQSTYIPYVVDVVSPETPLLDIGSGRGEWLQLLKENGISASGIDTNASSVLECTEKGLNVSHADAIAVLQNTKGNSLGAITLFQVLEHLPFSEMVNLLRLSLAALVPSGVLIAEVPNSETLSVGASTFWIDPTHERPVYPALLRFIAHEIGFSAVDGLYSSPLIPDPDFSELPKSAQNSLLAIHRQLNGYGDFALIAKA